MISLSDGTPPKSMGFPLGSWKVARTRKVQQDESYLSTGDLVALNTSIHTGSAPGSGFTCEHLVRSRSASRPCSSMDSTPIHVHHGISNHVCGLTRFNTFG